MAEVGNVCVYWYYLSYRAIVVWSQGLHTGPSSKGYSLPLLTKVEPVDTLTRSLKYLCSAINIVVDGSAPL